MIFSFSNFCSADMLNRKLPLATPEFVKRPALLILTEAWGRLQAIVSPAQVGLSGSSWKNGGDMREFPGIKELPVLGRNRGLATNAE